MHSFLQNPSFELSDFQARTSAIDPTAQQLTDFKANKLWENTKTHLATIWKTASRLRESHGIPWRHQGGQFFSPKPKDLDAEVIPRSTSENLAWEQFF